MVPVKYEYKYNCNLEIILNIKTIKCQCFEVMSPVVLLLKRVFIISFIDQCH